MIYDSRFKKYGLWILPIILYLLFMIPGYAEAAIYYASPAGSGATCSLSLPCSLQTALDKATAGSTVIANDGVYVGKVYARTYAGSASQSILLKSANLHKAILSGNGSDTDNANRAIEFHQPYWVMEGFELKNHQSGIYLGNAGHHTEIRNNIIHDFTRDGIWLYSSDNFIHHNVIAKCSCLSSANAWAGIKFDQNSGKNLVRENIIYSVTNNKYISIGGGFPTNGYPIFGTYNNDDNIIQGNLTMDGAKNSALRFYSASTVPDPNGPISERNLIRDNMALHGQGGGFALAENANDNIITNNISYGILHAGAEAKGNDPGRNTFTHNTYVLTNYSKLGLSFIDVGGIPSRSTIVKDNLMYSQVVAPFQSLYFVWPWGGSNAWTSTIKESNYNFLWSPDDESGWVDNILYGPNDIHSATMRPIFTDESSGDFSLAPGSPGRGGASDGTDIGANFNQYLKKSWIQNAINLPAQEKNTGGLTSVTFITNSANQYQVFAYVPDTNYYTGSETFYIEGVSGSGAINIQNDAIGSGYVGSAPIRYMYIGTYSNDGTLNIAWQHSNAASKVLIRQMPTPQEAYSWISASIAVPSTPLLGDINNDAIVNSLDWSLMSAKWLTNDTNADLNKDGTVNSLDWSIMSNNWLKTG